MGLYQNRFFLGQPLPLAQAGVKVVDVPLAALFADTPG
jgi:hypothetical protein